MSVLYKGENKTGEEVRAKEDAFRKSEAVVSSIKNWVSDDGDAARSEWITNQNKWHRLRMRIKKDKTFPFVGCSNIRMPTLDTKIKKLKASMMRRLFGIRPVVQIEPEGETTWEQAHKVEMFLDHLIMDIIKIKPKALIAIDRELEKGFTVMKPHWKTNIINREDTFSLYDIPLETGAWLFDIERTPEEVSAFIIHQLDIDMHDKVAEENEEACLKAADVILNTNKREIKVKSADVVYDFPDVALCAPEDIFVPSASGFDPQDCPHLVHEFWIPFSDLVNNAEQKGWNKTAVDEIIKQKKYDLDDKQITLTKDNREGITRLQDSNPQIRIWEAYGSLEDDGTGSMNQKIYTIAPDFSLKFREIVLPFWTGKKPFVKLYYELCDDRWYSHRGLPELLEDIVKEIDVQHMQKIDNQTLRNAPLFAYKQNQINPNLMQFIFGQGLAVKGTEKISDVIAPLNMHNTNVEYSYEREQMILETKIEELVGQIDFGLQSMINRREPRTKGEVDLQQQSAQVITTLDADTHAMCFQELFNWIWELWCQYGSDEYTFRYFADKKLPTGYDVKLGKEEIQGKYKIKIRGNDQNTNPQLRIQKASQILQASTNQIALSTGVVSPQNLSNAYKRFYQELDIEGWEEFVTDIGSPEVQKQRQQQQQEQGLNPELLVKLLKTGELTDMEEAQVLGMLRIQPDAKGRALQKQTTKADQSAGRN